MYLRRIKLQMSGPHSVSTQRIASIAKMVAGDHKAFPYQTGPKLVDFFNQFGSSDKYEGGFPTRWIYAKDKLIALNGTESFAQVLEQTFDAWRFAEAELPIEVALSAMNAVLKYDRLILVFESGLYRLRETVEGTVEFDPEGRVDDNLSAEMISEHLNKCDVKLLAEDYSGAITRARSLVESVLLALEKEFNPEAPPYDGDLVKLYRRLGKSLNLEPEKKDIADAVRQVISGLIGVINGLASLRNKLGDAHAVSYRARKHHAQLAVGAAKVMAHFLLESRDFQKLE